MRTVDAESKLQGTEGGHREGLQRLELERTQEFKAESPRAPRKKHVPAQCHDGLSWGKGAHTQACPRKQMDLTG